MIKQIVVIISIMCLFSGCYVTQKKKDLIESEYEHKVQECMLDKPLYKPVLRKRYDGINHELNDYIQFAKELVQYTETLEAITEECVTLKKNNYQWIEVKKKK